MGKEKHMPAEMLESIAEIREALARAKAAGRSVGFVPTMGALHEGHAALVRAARAAVGTDGLVVVSIFVNPTQFGPTEDLAKYPRTLEADQQLCSEAGADAIFAPSVTEMYPERSLTSVEVKELDGGLCGPSRPGHFRGVCTVVLKLFNIVQPDLAFFGAKDYQQARIVSQMVRDLNVPVEIRIEPTVREADGLAMSSRNRYLSPTERSAAPGIYRALQNTKLLATAGEKDVLRLESALRAALESIPSARIDYARIVDADTLQELGRLDRPAVAAVAVFIGSTRLIDNLVIPV